MLDLEARIRDQVNQDADAYQPPADLPGRIERRVRRRQASRRAVLAAAAALVALAAVAGGLSVPGRADRTNTTGGPAGQPTATTTSAPPTTRATKPTTTTTSETTTTTTATPSTPVPGATGGTTPPEPGTTTTTTGAPAAGQVTDDTPLSRSGVGPIQAGMTLSEAEAASGNDIVAEEPIGPDSTCSTAVIAGVDLVFMVGRDPAADPMDAVIQVVTGGTSSDEGISVGDSEGDVIAQLGEPTRRTGPIYTTVDTLVYEQGGVAFQYTIGTDDTVTTVASGYPTVYVEGCA